jgi:hypothetical protein
LISACSNCHRCYWRYRRTHPPSGFCSLLCQEVKLISRQQLRAGKDGDGPGIPAAILELIRSHHRIFHRNAPDDDWPDCAECERLEALHAAAIAWHMPPTVMAESLESSRQLENEAQRRVSEFYQPERRKA